MINTQQLRILGVAFLATLSLYSCGDDDGPDITPPTSSAIINAEVGGANQPNQVFIDLSTETQTAVARNSWDLGFTNDEDFRVIINNATSALAMPLDKTDLNAVNASDTTGLSNQLDIDAIFGALQGTPQAWLAQAASWLDDPAGDLNRTAISAINQSDDLNKVYILNRGKNPDGSQRGWAKVRVVRNGQGYTLQYADIAANNFQEINITKNADFNFSFINLSNSTISVEPAKENWDLAFTTFTTLLPVGPGTSIPYLFKDYVIQNRSGVEVATVEVINNQSYDTFSFADIAGQVLSSDLSTIGSSWRTVAQPGSSIPTGVKEEVFYLLKDGNENHYKLRFTRMLNPSTGERGFPQIQYDLLTEE